MTKISGKRTAKANFDVKAYASLLSEALPEVIETVTQNRRAIKIVKELMDKGEKLDA